MYHDNNSDDVLHPTNNLSGFDDSIDVRLLSYIDRHIRG
jgi:hypothetical protein